MNEIERAEQVANRIVEMDKQGLGFRIWHEDLAFGEKGFQELVIQHIRLRGYRVIRKPREVGDDGLEVRIRKMESE